MKQIQKTFFALGTSNRITVVCEEGMEAPTIEVLEKVKNRVYQLDDIFSVFKNTSEISCINQNAGVKAVSVSKDTFFVVKRAITYSIKSEGAFDITIRPLTKLWMKAKELGDIPSLAAMEEARDKIGYQNIEMEEKGSEQTIRLARKGQELDLGGIAKGYAADEAKKILVEAGILEAVINFGGTVIALGSEKKVGIQNPKESTGKIAGFLKVKDKAVVTSGDYERYFEKDGIRYHHLIDPRTGMPSKSKIAGISVIGEDAMSLDAISSAVFLLGIEKGAKLLEKCLTEGVFILPSNEVFVTKGLQDNFTLWKEVAI